MLATEDWSWRQISAEQCWHRENPPTPLCAPSLILSLPPQLQIKKKKSNWIRATLKGIWLDECARLEKPPKQNQKNKQTQKKPQHLIFGSPMPRLVRPSAQPTIVPCLDESFHFDGYKPQGVKARVKRLTATLGETARAGWQRLQELRSFLKPWMNTDELNLLRTRDCGPRRT